MTLIKKILLYPYIAPDKDDHQEKGYIKDEFDISYMLPFIPRQASRFQHDGVWYMGNRRQYDVIDPGRVICIAEPEPRIANESVLYAEAMKDIKTGTAHQTPHTQHSKKIFLFLVRESKILMSQYQLAPMDMVEFVADISAMPFVPGYGDQVEVQTQGRDEVFCVVHNRLQPDGSVFVMANECKDIINIEINSDVLLMPFFRFHPAEAGQQPKFMQRKPVTHLYPFIPGQGDLFRPFTDSKVDRGQPALWSYKRPNVIVCIGQSQRVHNVINVPLVRVTGG